MPQRQVVQPQEAGGQRGQSVLAEQVAQAVFQVVAVVAEVQTATSRPQVQPQTPERQEVVTSLERLRLPQAQSL